MMHWGGHFMVHWCSHLMVHWGGHFMMYWGGHFMHYRLMVHLLPYDFVMDRSLSLSHNRLMMCRLDGGFMHHLNWLRGY